MTEYDKLVKRHKAGLEGSLTRAEAAEEVRQGIMLERERCRHLVEAAVNEIVLLLTKESEFRGDDLRETLAYLHTSVLLGNVSKRTAK